VDRGDLASARRVLDEVAPGSAVELHTDRDVSLLRGWAELVGRAHRAPLDDVEVLVPGPEDALRLACLHGIKHGFERPAWLCDVALLVERLPDDLDWDHLLAGPPAAASWLRHAIALAGSVLDASTERVPRALALPATPAWIRAAVLEAWSRPRPCTDLVRVLRSRPWRLGAELRARWASPLAAAHRRGVVLGARPPAGIQATDYLARSAAYLPRVLSRRVRF
jgi:hypothetical protein